MTPRLWKLKGCPKCGGDLYFDPLSEDLECLQCSHAVLFVDPNRLSDEDYTETNLIRELMEA